MASLLISSITTLFLSSLFHLPSNAATSNSPSSDDLLKMACNPSGVVDPKAWDYNLCIQVLKSNPKVASSTKLEDLALNILEFGFSNVNDSRMYIINALNSKKIEPELQTLLKACNQSYELIYYSFRGAYLEVKEDKEYFTASYDLSLARNDYLIDCQEALVSSKVQNTTIAKSNKFVILFATAADAICTRLG